VTITVHEAPVVGLDPETLYRILALRVAVFVVEQECAYLELDGRDLEPETLLLWAMRDGELIATARLLVDPDGRPRIGRVATIPAARSAGIAAALIRRTLELSGPREVVLNAQSQLEAWYARFGFVRDGADYDEDGIAHLPMRRAAT
jgi:ElaA protein